MKEEMQGRGEFLLEQAPLSVRRGQLTNRADPYLDGTLVRLVDGKLAEWNGAGLIAGILLGPERAPDGVKWAAYVATDATVITDKVRIPSGLEATVSVSLARLDIVCRPPIQYEGSTEGSTEGEDLPDGLLTLGDAPLMLGDAYLVLLEE